MNTAPSSQTELLSTAKLRMNENVWRAHPEPDAVILRAKGREQRLVVTPVQAAILTEGFAEPKSVPQVLVRTIVDNRCPPLREFYELIVQAHDAGVLGSAPFTNAKPTTAEWPVRLPAKPAAFFGSAICVASLGFLAFTVPLWRGPEGWVDVVVGWIVACLLLSLGQLLAAGVIAACGEVRARQLFWRTRFPHFRIDTTEAIMGGRACEMTVAALRAAPILLGAAIATQLMPTWMAALCGASLYVLAPFGHSAARQWLSARRKAPLYSIRTDFLFEPYRGDWWAQWAARGRAFHHGFGAWGLAWAVVWSAWSIAAFLRCMPKTAATAKAWIQGSPLPLHLGAEYLLLAAIVLGFFIGAGAAIKHWLLQRAWSKPLGGREARAPRRPALTGERSAMLAEVPLFRELDAESRAAIAAAMEPVEFARRAKIFREDDPGDDFYVIVEGEVEIRKRLPGKTRSATIGWLGPGECFGEIALLESTARTATIVATRPTKLLKLGREQFEQLVMGRLGAATIRETLQHVRFLGRLTFTAGWPFAELLKFARCCRRVHIETGSAVVQQGERNHWFYLIYDGAFEARDGTRVLRRMGPGDYFGEISLLEGWDATATVVAIEDSRCLSLSRADFLELFARDFRIGLRMEAIAGQRLGSSVFSSQ